MAAEIRGWVVLDLTSREVPPARAHLDSLRAGRRQIRRAKLVVHDDGRASYAVPTTLTELGRVLQGIGLGTVVSVGASLAWSWMFYRALPAGAAVGVAFAAVQIARDRRRTHAEARALFAELPLLVRARRQ